MLYLDERRLFQGGMRRVNIFKRSENFFNEIEGFFFAEQIIKFPSFGIYRKNG